MHLGIDLGTSNSAVVGNINSQLRVFKTSDGSDVLPSVIYIDQRGHRLYGRRAYEQTRLSPDNVAKGFKRLMGTSTPMKFRASGQVMTPEECSAEILRQLVSQALLETNASEITGTAITIPAAFNQMQSEATLRAAAAAGLDRVVLLQEPIAAAMAQARNNSGQFLVYDLGGGTFDLALIQNLSGSINIIGHEGINMLGGQDFDRILIAEVIRPWLTETFSLPDDFQRQDKYGRLIGKSTMAAEAAKIDLSTTNTSTIFMSDEDLRVQDENGTDIYLDITVTRQQFEELVEPLLAQTLEMSHSIIKANGYTTKDIDRIVFVGGPSKMPWIRERVPRELGIAADLSVDPMTAVAMGAAIYAESREWAASSTKRKATRASTEVAPDLGLKFDYQARTSQDSCAAPGTSRGECRSCSPFYPGRRSRAWLDLRANNSDPRYHDRPADPIAGRKSISRHCVRWLRATDRPRGEHHLYHPNSFDGSRYSGDANDRRQSANWIDGYSEYPPIADQEGHAPTCRRVPTAEGSVRHWSEPSRADRPRTFSGRGSARARSKSCDRFLSDQSSRSTGGYDDQRRRSGYISLVDGRQRAPHCQSRTSIVKANLFEQSFLC